MEVECFTFSVSALVDILLINCFQPNRYQEKFHCIKYSWFPLNDKPFHTLVCLFIPICTSTSLEKVLVENHKYKRPGKIRRLD